jgi:hypothetical protein
MPQDAAPPLLSRRADRAGPISETHGRGATRYPLGSSPGLGTPPTSSHPPTSRSTSCPNTSCCELSGPPDQEIASPLGECRSSSEAIPADREPSDPASGGGGSAPGADGAVPQRPARPPRSVAPSAVGPPTERPSWRDRGRRGVAPADDPFGNPPSLRGARSTGSPARDVIAVASSRCRRPGRPRSSPGRGSETASATGRSPATPRNAPGSEVARSTRRSRPG